MGIKRHILFKGANVKICINGTVPSSVQEPVAGQGLKNSAHGQIVVLGIPVPVPVPFCEVTLNACTGSSPACSDLKPGAPVQLCSSLSVPTATPDTDVDVTWKVWRVESRRPVRDHLGYQRSQRQGQNNNGMLEHPGEGAREKESWKEVKRH